MIKRILQNFKFSKANKTIFLKEIYPCYFSIYNDIGTLAFLCITEENKNIILSCNYDISDVEDKSIFYNNNLYNDLSNSQQFIMRKMIIGLDNYLTDLEIEKDNQLIGCKVDNNGALISDYVLFKFNDNILPILGLSNYNISTATHSGDFNNIAIKLNSISKIKTHFIKEIVKIRSIAPVGSTRFFRKTKEIIVWFECIDNTPSRSKFLNSIIGITCNFDLNKAVNTSIFKEKELLFHDNYIKNRSENDCVISLMVDFDLFKYQDNFEMLFARDKNNNYHLIFLDNEVKENLLYLIKNYK